MKILIPFNIAVMFFMVLSGFTLIMFTLGMTSEKLSQWKYYKFTLTLSSGLLFLLLLLASIFVVEW